MCGIAGIFDKNQADWHSEIKQMADVLKHRGPDGEGFWHNRKDGIWLGHRRLAILDLSENGKQPMSNAVDRYTITFNGEIYNYVELKKELIELGYSFHTETDTEVLLALFDYRGAKCLDYLDGMFSFAIWDSVAKKLFCARDRFGEKPFYYYYKNSKFYFASEMKALWAVGIPKRLKLDRVSDFLNFSRISEVSNLSSTFYENIYQLPNGCFLEIELNTFVLNIEQYYLFTVKKNDNIKFEDAKERFLQLFRSSIEKRLRSDVPVGTGLSGGMDSSSIVAMINEINNGRVKQNTFSARFKGFEKDEGKYINSVLKSFPAIKHYEVWPTTEEFENTLEKLVYHQEEPFGSTSMFAQWKVMECVANSDVKVLLDGQGADEYLAGYLYYYSRRMYNLFYTNHSLFEKERDGYFQLRNSKVPFQDMESIRTKVHGWIKRRMKKVIDIVDLDELLLKDCFKGELQELLRYGDRNSMAHSIEIRAPFLNHELVEFVFSLPDHFKLINGWTKYILRSSMESYLPNNIVWRVDKIGYATPQEKIIENVPINKHLIQFIADNKIEILNVPKWNSLIISKFI